eukprot:gene13329-17866_t
MNCFLYILPTDILCHLFSEWLLIVDVSTLDCALCCHRNFVRQNLLSIISENSINFPFSALVVSFNLSYWSWLVKRNFSVKTLNFKRELLDLSVVLNNFNMSEIKTIPMNQQNKISKVSTSKNDKQSDFCIIFNILDRVEFIRFYSPSILQSLLEHETCKKLSLVCTNLKKISITGFDVTDESLSLILESNSHCLSKLELQCNSITGMNILPSFLTNLKELKILYCASLQEEGWNKILVGLKNLTSLAFHSSSINMLRNALFHLVHLRFLECSLDFQAFDDFSGLISHQNLDHLILVFRDNSLNELQFQSAFSDNLLKLEHLALSSMTKRGDKFDIAPLLPQSLVVLNLSQF